METTSKTSKLRECPFCGDDTSLAGYVRGLDFPEYYIYCQNCDTRGPSADTSKMARKCWNNRPDSGR